MYTYYILLIINSYNPRYISICIHITHLLVILNSWNPGYIGMQTYVYILHTYGNHKFILKHLACTYFYHSVRKQIWLLLSWTWLWEELNPAESLLLWDIKHLPRFSEFLCHSILWSLVLEKWFHTRKTNWQKCLGVFSGIIGNSVIVPSLEPVSKFLWRSSQQFKSPFLKSNFVVFDTCWRMARKQWKSL